MIRPARMIDTPRLVELIEEQHARSKYADTRLKVDAPYARKLVAQMIQRHGGMHDGGCLVMVEEVDGCIVAFIAAMLHRVYHVGNMLAPSDVFLVATKDAPARSALDLFDRYVNWAMSNPRVFEIHCGWTDALPEGHRMDAVYRRKGFQRFGAIYSRTNDAACAKAAA
jgi:hypothetical protein